MAKNKKNNNNKYNAEFAEEVVEMNNKRAAQNSPGESASKNAKR
ncbi:hypothetical protein [Paenibacillus contaminans]|jgi:hypothetical protein|nr:hypothetical protein [Paenibacillus contaminans]